MKLRHAAALALVGWYLMVPPVGCNGKQDRSAPLGEWTDIPHGTFDTARECDEQLAKDLDANSKADGDSDGPVKQAQAQWNSEVSSEQCIASDDPRLAK